jgi:ABC-type uncharacterized transport system substrate-binding protein
MILDFKTSNYYEFGFQIGNILKKILNGKSKNQIKLTFDNPTIAYEIEMKNA